MKTIKEYSKDAILAVLGIGNAIAALGSKESANV